jgi:peptidoglycan biosynthesis protein MviN/MurJ (putative lipid II flippase)
MATVPGLSIVGGFAIEFFLGGEAFDEEDVARTTLLLGAFALSVPLEAATHLLSRAIYATRNTILPVISSVVGLVVTILAVNALLDEQGVLALPLGFAIGLAAKVTILGVALLWRLRSVGGHGTRPASSSRISTIR